MFSRNGLKPNGVIILKENVTSGEDLELDRQDSSVTRSMGLFKQVFEKASLICYRVVKQQHFPKGLYSVYMFVLKPKVKDIIDDSMINSQDQNNTEYEEKPIYEGNSIKLNNKIPNS